MYDSKKRINEHEYLLNRHCQQKESNHPHGPKSQNPTAVYALLPLIAEVIPLKLILCILKLFPQSLNNANNSSSMALRRKNPLVPGLQNFTRLLSGGYPNPVKAASKERQNKFLKCLKAQTLIQ